MTAPLWGWPIFSDVGSFYSPQITQGSWLAGLPATNVQTKQLHDVARSTDETAANTKMEFDLGVARPLRVCFTLLPNISTSGATIRWRGSDTAATFGSPLFDSTAVAAWPSGVTAEMAEHFNVWHWYVIPSETSARYVLMEIVDTSNADGYVDVARVGVCGGFQPTGVGVSQGLKMGYEDDTVITTTDGGADTFNVKRRRRTQIGVVQQVAQAEAFLSAFRMKMQAGISGQFFWIPDPDMDASYAWQHCWLATAKEASALDFVSYNRLDVAFNNREVL